VLESPEQEGERKGGSGPHFYEKSGVPDANKTPNNQLTEWGKRKGEKKYFSLLIYQKGERR